MHFMITNLAPLVETQPYLDPGSGSILIQMLVAGALGAGILFRSIWKKINPKKSKPEDTTNELNPEDKSMDNGE